MSSIETPAANSQPNRKFVWIAIGVVAVIAVGTSAGLVAAALSSSSSTPATQTPSSGVTPLTNPNGAFPGGLATPQAVGVVATVSSSKFTIATRQGSTDTVVVTSSTTFSGPGITALSSLKKGSSVAVYGKFTSASTIAASRVTSGLGGPGQGRFGGRGAFGAIASIGFDSFTITSFNGAKETIQVSSFTSYEDSSGTISGLSALKKGQDVIVRGVVSGSVVKATDIRVVVPGTGGGFGGGGFGGGVPPNSGGSTGL